MIMHVGPKSRPKSLYTRSLFCTCIHISIPAGIMGVNPCCCKEFDTRTMPELFYILETYRTLNCNRYCHSSVAHMNIFKYRYLKTPYRDIQMAFIIALVDHVNSI